MFWFFVTICQKFIAKEEDLEAFEEEVDRDALEEEDGEGREAEVIEQYQDVQELHYIQGKDSHVLHKKQ